MNPLSPLLGRDSELAALCRDVLADDRRITTVTGPVGVGKSRLAAAAADRVAAHGRHAVHRVDLAAPEHRGEPVRELAGYVGRALSPGCARSLLVLDNCEYAGERLAQFLLSRLLEDPMLSVLATSREPLRVTGERLFLLRPLPLPAPGQSSGLDEVASVTLLVWQVTAARPEFALTKDNERAVAELCGELDGLPLAIEYAAARLKIHQPATLLAELRSSLDELAYVDRVPALRQEGIAAALDRYLHTVPPEASRLLAALSTFPADFGLADVEAALDLPPLVVRRLLELLVDKNLVQLNGQDGAEPRFVLLRTTRRFVRDQVSAAPLPTEDGKGESGPLTARQFEVAALVASGATNRAIARQLGIAEWTAINHVRQLMRRLGFTSRVEVAGWMARQQKRSS